MPLESCWEPMVSLWLVLIIGKDSDAQSRNIKVKVYEISLTDVNSMKEYKNIASTRYFGCKITYILLFCHFLLQYQFLFQAIGSNHG